MGINTSNFNFQGIGTVNITGVPGCTDPNAINYDPLATIDDGTCFIGDTTHIPDANFRAILDQKHTVSWYNDNIASEYVLTNTINTIENLECEDEGILDLTGIEDFIALTYLNCYSNQLTNLDLSANTALTNLQCGSNQLANLNVTNNVALTYLSCHNNQLAILNTSGATALADLFCNNNQIISLDVSSNTALILLNCHDNQLTTLNVKNGNNVNFSSFSAHSNPNLYCINVDDASYAIENWTNIDPWTEFSVDCVNINLTRIPDINFRAKLQSLGYATNWYDANGVITNGIIGEYCYTSNISSILSLTVVNAGIADLTGIEGFTALTYLAVYNTLTTTTPNQLTSIDLSNNTSLESFGCFRNQLTSLDVSNNIALRILFCNFNQLTSIDVSNNTLLTSLNCHNNQLTTLDVSVNTSLTFLTCDNNQLTSLDVRNGNNINFTTWASWGNPSLYCINVDDPVYSTANWTDIDSASSFSENCDLDPSSSFSASVSSTSRKVEHDPSNEVAEWESLASSIRTKKELVETQNISSVNTSSPGYPLL